MKIASIGDVCFDSYDCASGQCYRGVCFDAKLSCSATKLCAAGLTCSSGKCVCKFLTIKIAFIES